MLLYDPVASTSNTVAVLDASGSGFTLNSRAIDPRVWGGSTVIGISGTPTLDYVPRWTNVTAGSYALSNSRLRDNGIMTAIESPLFTTDISGGYELTPSLWHSHNTNRWSYIGGLIGGLHTSPSGPSAGTWNRSHDMLAYWVKRGGTLLVTKSIGTLNVSAPETVTTSVDTVTNGLYQTQSGSYCSIASTTADVNVLVTFEFDTVLDDTIWRRLHNRQTGLEYFRPLVTWLPQTAASWPKNIKITCTVSSDGTATNTTTFTDIIIFNALPTFRDSLWVGPVTAMGSSANNWLRKIKFEFTFDSTISVDLVRLTHIGFLSNMPCHLDVPSMNRSNRWSQTQIFTENQGLRWEPSTSTGPWDAEAGIYNASGNLNIRAPFGKLLLGWKDATTGVNVVEGVFDASAHKIRPINASGVDVQLGDATYLWNGLYLKKDAYIQTSGIGVFGAAFRIANLYTTYATAGFGAHGVGSTVSYAYIYVNSAQATADPSIGSSQFRFFPDGTCQMLSSGGPGNNYALQLTRSYTAMVNEKAMVYASPTYTQVEANAVDLQQVFRANPAFAYTTVNPTGNYIFSSYAQYTGVGGTSVGVGFYSGVNAVAGHTLTSFIHFNAATTSGVGTFTTVIGFNVANQTVGNNVYGFKSAITAGANRYSIYTEAAISRFGGVIESAVATGTPPFTLSSTTQIPNLNASYLANEMWHTQLSPGKSAFGGAMWDVIDGRWEHTEGTGKYAFTIKHTDGQGVTAGMGGALTLFMGDLASTGVGSSAMGGSIKYFIFDKNGTLFSSQFNSSVVTGTAPLTVASTTLCSNLNADLWDSSHLNTHTASVRANSVITGGGIITFSATGELTWSARMIVIANGKGTWFGTSGFFDISVPIAGTVITGVGGANNQTVVAAGIPITNGVSGWCALYYILPLGAANTTVPANFRLVGYTIDLEIPEHWVCICRRNGDSGTLFLNNGLTLRVGQAFDTNNYSSANPPQFGGQAPTYYLNTSSTAQTKTGALTVTQLTSTIATGTAPLVVTSTTLVPNLNVGYLNSQLGSYYTSTANHLMPTTGAFGIAGALNPMSHFLNVTGDALAFKTISNSEYWDFVGLAWVANTDPINKLLTGRVGFGDVSIPTVRRKFRFVTPVDPWLGEVILMAHQTYGTIGAHQIILTAEYGAASTGPWNALISYTSPAGENNYHVYAWAAHNRADGFIRITVESLDATNLTWYTGIQLLYTYTRSEFVAGGPILPFTWDYTGTTFFSRMAVLRSTFPALVFRQTGDANNHRRLDVTSNNFRIQKTNDDYSVWTHQLTLTSTGFCGIGDLASGPTHALHVNTSSANLAQFEGTRAVGPVYIWMRNLNAPTSMWSLSMSETGLFGIYGIGPGMVMTFGTTSFNWQAYTTLTINDAGNCLVINAAIPRQQWNETDAAIDNKYWDLAIEGGACYYRLINDARSVTQPWLSVTRSGTTASEIKFNCTSLKVGTSEIASQTWVDTGYLRRDAGNSMTSSSLISNLNADYLDGMHASAFLLLTGGIMTGNLHLHNNSSIFFQRTGDTANRAILTDYGVSTTSGASSTEKVGVTWGGSGSSLFSVALDSTTRLLLGSTGVDITGSVVATVNVSGVRLVATQATGTSPLAITSTTVCANLNADYLDGNHSTAFATATHTHSNLSVSTTNSLTGGGDLSASRTLSLVGDAASPGNSYYYGTNASGTKGWYTLPAGGGGGTVTSVGLTAPAFMTAGGTNPVITSGTITLTWASQTAKYVLVAPNASAGAPTFRLLVASDIPTLPQSQITSLTTDLADRLSKASGGTVVGNTTFSGALSLTGTHTIKAAAGGTAGLYFACWLSDPTTTGQALQHRTPAQVRSDIGAGTGSGTVTSVDLTAPAFLTVGGTHPVISSGTIALTLATQAQNSVFAGPTSGTGTPTFRALVAADIPSLSATYAPLVHSHGNMSNGGYVSGATAGTPFIAGASGLLQGGSWGTIAGTACQGNDPRLAGDNFPTSDGIYVYVVSGGGTTKSWQKLEGTAARVTVG